MVNKMPIVGISGSVMIDQGGMFPGYHRSYVNEDYVNSVIQNGGIPVIIPVSDVTEVLDSYIDKIDALILSGGHDVCSMNYNEEPCPKMGDIFPERDKFDFALLERAEKKRIPILGICRGAQVINVYHGGSLYQDVSMCDTAAVKHWQGHFPEQVTHSVDIMKNVAPDFNVVARAADGVVEAIEHKDYPMLIGVQWHPEMMHKKSMQMNLLFNALINNARKDCQMCEI